MIAPKLVLIIAPPEPEYESARLLAMCIKDALTDQGVVAYLESELGEYSANPDLVIVVGGDGSILRALKKFIVHQVPIFGINGGDVGFLTTANQETFESAVERIAKGAFEIEERSGLEFMCRGQRYGPFVNEVELWQPDKQLYYDVLVNGQQRYGSSLLAAGILVATQTGSTAKNHSAGRGPIIAPGVQGHTLTPLHPNAFNTPPMIIGELVDGGMVELGIQRIKHGDPPRVQADGQIIIHGTDALQIGERIVIREHDRPFLLASFGYDTFGEGLEKKGFASR